MAIDDKVIYGKPSVGTVTETDESGKKRKKETKGYELKKEIDLSAAIITCVTDCFGNELENVPDGKFMMFEDRIERLVRNCLTGSKVKIRDFLSEETVKKLIADARDYSAGTVKKEKRRCKRS